MHASVAAFQVIRPILEAAGFSRFVATRAWRLAEGRTDVVAVHRFPAGRQGLGASAFGLEAGCHFDFVPDNLTGEVKRDAQGRPRPLPTQCHLRYTTYASPGAYAENTPRNAWTPPPAAFELAAEGLSQTVSTVLIPWLDRWRDLTVVLEVLETEQERETAAGKSWGFGRLGSRARCVMAGFVALRLGKYSLAVTRLTESLEKRNAVLAEMTKGTAVGALSSLLDEKVRAALVVAETRRAS
jgi:hypothetical protein